MTAAVKTPHSSLKADAFNQTQVTTAAVHKRLDQDVTIME